MASQPRFPTSVSGVLAVVMALAFTACSEISLPDGDGGNGKGNGDAGGGSPISAGPVGSMGQVLLSASTPRAIVEIDTTDGASLGDAARGALEDRLREHGNKEEVVYRDGSTVPAQQRYSDDDLRQIAAEHRGGEPGDGTVRIYVLVLEGRSDRGDAVGVAFDAISFAIFPEQISGGPLGLSSGGYEEAVAVHELGHLFGLVNLTGEGAFHEDPENPGHSRNEDSVMYWRVEDASITSFFDGGPPTEFDEADRREMDRIRG